MNHQTHIHEEIAGQGQPLVVLHGLFGDLDNFRSIALHLERYFRVIRLDLPGHGQSTTLDDLSIASLAKAVLAHLGATGVDQFHLLGHSLGGKVAMQMAANDTVSSIQKLIVVDIAPRFYPPHHKAIFEALIDLPLNEIGGRSDADKHLRKSIPDAGVRGFLLKSLHRKSDDTYQWQFDLQGLMADYEAIQQAPVFIAPVDAPTLFIKGGNSDYLGPQDELPIRTNFANPSFKEIGGTGHWPHAEKPALFTRICLEFLEQSIATDSQTSGQ